MNGLKLIKCLYILVLPTIFACSNNSDIDLVEKDLLEYGLPITIQAPDSIVVKTMDWLVQKDVTIKGPDWYSLQIFSSKAQTTKIEDALRLQKSTVEDGTYFDEFILEEQDGFIYQLKIDSITNYDFRHVKIQGDNEYIFQAGMMGNYTQAQVERLYEIAKLAK